MGQISFGHPWAATLDFDATNYLPTTKVLGLSMAESWLFTHLRGKGSDSIHHLVRTIRAGTTTGCMVATAVEDGVRYREDAAKFLRGGAVRRHVREDGSLCIDGSLGYFNGGGGPEVHAVLGPKTMTWSDSGHLELTGKIMGPGLVFCIPGFNDEAMFYSHLYYEVEGTFFGEPVEGIVPYENCWLPTGKLYTDGPILQRYEEAWCAFATIYEDGSVQYGQLAGWSEGMAFADIWDNGRHIACPILSKEVTWRPDGFADRVQYNLANGETWEFCLEDRGILRSQWEMAQATGQNFRVHKGTANRVGETRKRRVHYALVEIFPDRIGRSAKEVMAAKVEAQVMA